MLKSIEDKVATIKQLVENAERFGLVGGAVTYEGGPHYNGDGYANLDYRTAAQKHPAMTDLVSYYILNYWYGIGGGLFNYFAHTGASASWGYWGNLDNLSLEQFMNAPKFAALKYVSQSEIGHTVDRPDVEIMPPYSNPLAGNGSFEAVNPRLNWTFAAGWAADLTEAADGLVSLKATAAASGWQASRWTADINLKANKDYVLVFWHKGLAGYKVSIGNGSVITEADSDWKEYIVPFTAGSDPLVLSMVQDAFTAEGNAWFDFFYIEENAVANGSFERDNEGWNNATVADLGAEAADGKNALKVSGAGGTVFASGFNSVNRESEYRLIAYAKGDGDTMVAFYDQGDFHSPYGMVEDSDIVITQNDDWTMYEAVFETHKMSQATQVKSGQVKITTTGNVGEAYIDNVMVFLKRAPVKGERPPVVYRTVKFMVDEEEYDTQSVESGKTATKPAVDPVKAGYTFKYWSRTENGTAYNFATTVTSDRTLYAVWEKIAENEFAVTFMVDEKHTIALLSLRASVRLLPKIIRQKPVIHSNIGH
jgi:uncharacterized repeat protein (TIGR02543 family)